MKYVLGIFGFIILTVIAVVLLATTTGNRSTRKLEGERVVKLTDYADNGELNYTIQGEIVGEEDYKSIRITITPTGRRVQVLAGYTGRVEKEQTFPNNSEAFNTFLHALTTAGYTLERKVEDKDVRGKCPLGKRYLYSLNDGDKQVVDLWSTTCSTREGTFGGDDGLVRELFQTQIPEYGEFVADARL